MATYVKYQLATEKMVEGGNMGSDTWQMILSNTAPTVATDTTAASATELSTSGGYTAGGKQRKKVLKDIKRLNELILRRKIDTPIITIQPHDETDDEEALMLLL